LSDPLALLPGYALRRASNAMMGRLAKALSVADLGIAEATVLMSIGERRDLKSSDLGRILDIRRANMVPLLKRLEDKGLIDRIPIDGKSRALVLTPPGKAVLREVLRITSQFEADLLARIPDEHRAHLLPALNCLWGEGTTE